MTHNSRLHVVFERLKSRYESFFYENHDEIEKNFEINRFCIRQTKIAFEKLFVLRGFNSKFGPSGVKWHYMKYDLISTLTRSLVFMESKKIDFNKQGIKLKLTELGYKRKQYDELRKVLKLKDHNLIQANHGLANILIPSVFVWY